MGALFAVVAVVMSQNAVPAAPADEQASAYACTKATLLSGKTCTFEGSESSGAKAPAQQAHLKAMAETFCPQAATHQRKAPDAEALRLCKADFVEQLKGACTGDVPFLDERERFTPPGRECYRALGEILAATRSAAALAHTCCQCISVNRCGATLEQCYRTIHTDSLRTTSGACLKGRCQEACRSIVPPRATPAQVDADKETDSDE